MARRKKDGGRDTLVQMEWQQSVHKSGRKPISSVTKWANLYTEHEKTLSLVNVSGAAPSFWPAGGANTVPTNSLARL